MAHWILIKNGQNTKKDSGLGMENFGRVCIIHCTCNILVILCDIIVCFLLCYIMCFIIKYENYVIIETTASDVDFTLNYLEYTIIRLTFR